MRVLLIAILLVCSNAFAQGPGQPTPPNLPNVWVTKEAAAQFLGPTMTAYKADLAKISDYKVLESMRAAVLADAKNAVPGSREYVEASMKEYEIRLRMNQIKPDPTRGPSVAPR